MSKRGRECTITTLMSPRKSKRTSAVLKRRLLEKKLELRKQRALRRQNRSQSKNTEKSDAAKSDSDLKQKHLDEKLRGALSHSHSEESLEWDDSNETAPSFVTNSWESDQLEEALINLYSSWEAPENQENYPLESTPVDSRRKTSTDHNFLRESVAKNPPIRHFSWPPRFPSQEVENISLDHEFLNNPQSPFLATDLVDEVFEDIEEESDREDLNNCLDRIYPDRTVQSFTC